MRPRCPIDGGALTNFCGRDVNVNHANIHPGWHKGQGPYFCGKDADGDGMQHLHYYNKDFYASSTYSPSIGPELLAAILGPQCGATIWVKNTGPYLTSVTSGVGNCIEAKLVDQEGGGAADLNPAAWKALTNESPDGQVSVEWYVGLGSENLFMRNAYISSGAMAAVLGASPVLPVVNQASLRPSPRALNLPTIKAPIPAQTPARIPAANRTVILPVAITLSLHLNPQTKRPTKPSMKPQWSPITPRMTPRAVTRKVNPAVAMDVQSRPTIDVVVETSRDVPPALMA
ncbi:MAG: hypothetical protein Q9198_005227 [Flavoplaca austrocitrina]